MTFADLNTPFSLFEAPITDAAEYCGKGECFLCGQPHPVCFTLSIGNAIIGACIRCGTENGLDASDREAVECRKCSSLISFPPSEDEIAVCYPCLRDGKAAMTKDTELGMISWEQAFDGLSHGVPGLNHPDFEMVATDSDWVKAKLPQTLMFELLRSPSFHTIQGACWLFCCQYPMTFVGCWEREDFTENAEDHDGKALFAKIVERTVPGLWEDNLHDETGIYVFQCKKCGRRRANWDLA